MGPIGWCRRLLREIELLLKAYIFRCLDAVSPVLQGREARRTGKAFAHERIRIVGSLLRLDKIL
jgi:hypothetical protein